MKLFENGAKQRLTESSNGEGRLDENIKKAENLVKNMQQRVEIFKQAKKFFPKILPALEKFVADNSDKIVAMQNELSYSSDFTSPQQLSFRISSASRSKIPDELRQPFIDAGKKVFQMGEVKLYEPSRNQWNLVFTF